MWAQGWLWMQVSSVPVVRNRKRRQGNHEGCADLTGFRMDNLLDIDNTLVRQARTNRDAFGRLYDYYYPVILRYCIYRLYGREVAEDTTSEIFLQVAKNIHGLNDCNATGFRNWIYTIANNEISAYFRKQNRRKHLMEAACQAGVIDTACYIEDAADGEIEWPELHQAILQLKPQQQAVITLRFFEEMSNDDIAQILGVKPGAVRTAASRATTTLGRILQTCFSVINQG